MTTLKPGKEIFRVYAIEDESGDVCGMMVASQVPDDLVRDTLKKLVEQIEKGQGQHIKDVRIKNPGDITFHTGA